MSRSQELTPKPSLSLTSTSRHRGTLLSHETRKVACSNPYLIQPFHIWIISQARDDFPGYKDWLLLSATRASPDQCCRGLRGRSTAPASFPLSQEVTLFFFFFFLPTFLFLIGKLLLCPDLKWGCPSRVTVELSMFSGSTQIWADLRAPGSLPSRDYLAQPFFVVLGSCNTLLKAGHLSTTWNTAKRNACYRSHSD